ncbi:hypothetical protein E1162_03110 [Rhodobacteraceae bacterium RKSG542]|uniref:hypothetical protein n=1 Tax=Pseudovibrio flavus TaxID=2529854 RepID=UPI0012BD6967|nr:hypothetical protein [Pseudovibrio flavus]MTI16225.1 hypothetical protein [Pseudovibrio flavus]
MSRRLFFTGVCQLAFLVFTAGAIAQPLGVIGNRVSSTLTAIDQYKGAGDRLVTAKQVADFLGEGLTPTERRIAAFEFVRSYPFRLQGDGGVSDNSLFNLGAGDGRHKAAALKAILEVWGEEVYSITVPFDWADLPVPVPVLSKLTDTRSFHNALVVKTGERWIIVDATWDPALEKLGFPVVSDWNGHTSTLSITPKATQIEHARSFKTMDELYTRYAVAKPNEEQVHAFISAFNGWIERARRVEHTET